jgi:hypothetical protein
LLPTPTASTYGSSQNGINGKGGSRERLSAGTPSLFTMARRDLLPTPTAMDLKSTGTAFNRKSGSSRHAGTTLTDAVVRGPSLTGAILPTPMTTNRKLHSASSRLPTPCARDIKGPGHYENESPTLHAALLPLPTPTTRANQRSNRGKTTVQESADGSRAGGSHGRRLSPRFVEWMMGVPTDYTTVPASLIWSAAEVVAGRKKHKPVSRRKKLRRAARSTRRGSKTSPGPIASTRSATASSGKPPRPRGKSSGSGTTARSTGARRE